MESSYILSRYTVLFRSLDGEALCYNSRSNCFLALSDGLYDYLQNSKDIDVNALPEEIGKLLLKMKAVVTDDEDATFLNRLQVENNIRIYSREHISLTLLPTSACNLKCPYCYEINKSKKVMTPQVIDNLISFLNQHKYAKTYSITWYGGEPLLAIHTIEEISKRLKEEVKLQLTGQTMVTNGVLLNQRAIEILKNIHIGNLQITFDGMPARHDQVRFLPNHKGTFDIILSNIKAYLKAFPDRFVSIRVNIDNRNKGDFSLVYSYLRKELSEHLKRIYIYPGILKDENPNHSICNSSLMTSKDIKELYLDLHKQGTALRYYPERRMQGCSANNICNYVIGPEGEIYKCWVEVGEKDCIIGNIADHRFPANPLFVHYFAEGNCFNDPQCLKCPILPICSGGCPNSRIQNKLRGKQIEVCPMYHVDNNQGLLEFLQLHYQLKKKKDEIKSA